MRPWFPRYVQRTEAEVKFENYRVCRRWNGDGSEWPISWHGGNRGAGTAVILKRGSRPQCGAGR